MATRGDKISEGKSKVLFATDDPDLLMQYFKDDATAFNGVKKGTIQDKGVFNCQISTRIYKLLTEAGIKTHLVETVSDREQLIRKVEIVPVEFIVRNRVAGSLAKRYGLEEGPDLSRPLLEYFVKDDDLGDPLIGREACDVLGYCDLPTLDILSELTLRINGILVRFFAELGISLVDYKLEFGRCGDELLLADEISPDSCRLWDAETGEKLDKDRFRRDLGRVEESYAKVASLVAQAIPL